MAKCFISCAMDLGITHSCMAVMTPQGPRVIKVNGIDAVVPSAVYEDNHGRRFIGRSAMMAMMTNPAEGGIGHTGFKVRMGHDDRYVFPSGKVLSPQELTSLIIGELWKAYLEENNVNHQSCVLTVPAIFRHSACKAMIEAAELAGLKFVTTLMEPIAAAIAYGFSAEDRQAKWIVFDLGGGMLDVSLVLMRDGKIEVPKDGNTGNDLLGGRKFDRELMDYVLGPRKSDPDYKEKMKRYREMNPDYHPLREQYDLEDFSKQSRHSDWGRLMMAVETAKIQLFTKKEAIIETSRTILDSKKKECKIEIPLSRSIYERLIRPDVETAVVICEQLLRRNKLKLSDIQRLVLVGEAAKTPFIQQMLAERLGIPSEASIDPMTVVVQGAAIYADTVEVPEDLIPQDGRKTPESSLSSLRVRLEYEPYSNSPAANVTGCVSSDSQLPQGLSVEIRRKDGLWSSTRIPLDENGFFTADVELIQSERPTKMEFETRVLDGSGQVIVFLDEPGIWYLYPSCGDALPSHLMIGIGNNMTYTLLEKGMYLPAEKTEELLVIRRTEKGFSGDVLIIPVYESVEHFLGGVDPHCDCNLKVGEIRISANNLPCELPAGSTVQITICRDRDRQIRVQAYVPRLDEEFKAVFDSHSIDLTIEDMESQLEMITKKLKKIEQLQSEHPIPEVSNGLKQLKQMEVLPQIWDKLQAARDGDKESQSRCHGDIVRMTGALNHLQAIQERNKGS